MIILTCFLSVRLLTLTNIYTTFFFLQIYVLFLFSSTLFISLARSVSLAAASPESQLLKQVTRGPWGLPMDQTLRRATDTTAVQLSEMVSLPVLIKHSVTTPLITQ